MTTEEEDDYLHELGLGTPKLPPAEHIAPITRYRGSLNSEYFRAMAELRRLKKVFAASDGIYSVPGEEEESESVEPENGQAGGQGGDGINSVLTTEEENEIYQTNPNAESGPENLGFSPVPEPAFGGNGACTGDPAAGGGGSDQP